MSKILIIGGGAAGMMTGVYLARAGHEVHILEKNEKLGKKVYITGKGRCRTKILSEPEVTAIADVKMGDKTATAWGCDLTHGYIEINADYRS